MTLEALETGAFQEICYLIWNRRNEAVVVDPGFDADRILERIESNRLEVKAYLCTHGHADHINALSPVHAAHPAPIRMHALDLQWAFEPINQIAPYYGIPKKPDTDILPLEPGAVEVPAELAIRCIETPGHTPGSCCLLFSETQWLVAGDTLFKGSCGRTDLPGGDPRKLKESLHKLKQLPDDVRVYPGHGPDTTIGIERATNFFMQ